MTTTMLCCRFVVHKWTSLICMLFYLVVGVTGLPMLFSGQIRDAFIGNDDAMNATPPIPPPSSSPSRASVSVWPWPMALGLLTVFGLLSALLGQHGVWLMLSWISLSIPLVVMFACFVRARRRAPLSKEGPS